MSLSVGDRVKVTGEVWDDHRESLWTGWEGVVQQTSNPKNPDDPYQVYVFFPKSRGKWRFFDFSEDELEVVEHASH